MKTRLVLFFATLLILPPFARLLSGERWESGAPVTILSPQSLLLATLLIASFAVLANRIAILRGGADLRALPRLYWLYLVASSMMGGWLLVTLNHYAETAPQPMLDAAMLLSCSALFSVLMPSIVATRSLLATFTPLLHLAQRLPAFAAPAPGPMALSLLTLALAGLMAGVVRPQWLWPLLWSAPLWLLLALQLLWHENTLFSGLPRGDWHRPMLAALSGLIVGILLVTSYAASGGSISLPAPATLSGFILFGLLSSQLNELIASHWRGKSRSELRKRKAFPIPVVRQD